MITHFADSDTENFFHGQRVAKFAHVERVAMKKLQMLNAATDLRYLRSPPANRLEALKGERCGQYSIRINDQYRLCFCWQNGHATHVEIVDYH